MEEVPSFPKLLFQGAESRVFLDFFLGSQCIVKERFKKEYRNPILDGKIRPKRTLQEARNMDKARKAGVNTPYLLYVDLNTCKIYQEYLTNSVMTKEYFFYLTKNKLEYPVNLLTNIGRGISALHEAGIVHGDLTTSNMMIKFNEKSHYDKVKNNEPFKLEDDSYTLYFIDFGLSEISETIEDKAVDLYVLEKAFLSTHTENQAEFDKILEAYEKASPKSEKIIKRLNDVRLRGRKKLAFG